MSSSEVVAKYLLGSLPESDRLLVGYRLEVLPELVFMGAPLDREKNRAEHYGDGRPTSWDDFVLNCDWRQYRFA